jgi:hypothetical protein
MLPVATPISAFWRLSVQALNNASKTVFSCFEHSNFGHLDLFRVSDVVATRLSDFGFARLIGLRSFASRFSSIDVVSKPGEFIVNIQKNESGGVIKQLTWTEAYSRKIPDLLLLKGVNCAPALITW